MIRNWEDVERHVQDRIPETPALDYKQELHLDPPAQRREVLKDITGMGNGGGGLIVYGIAETTNDDGIPSKTTPLTDQRLIGRLEDIIRSTVSPPLLYNLRTVDSPSGGYVLVIDIQRSPLGPYMVQSRGDFRYYQRQGTSTGPMSETEVRDAYSLAARHVEHRAALWDDLGLPARPGGSGPWLIVSTVPREPLTDHLDPSTTEASAFALPEDLRRHSHFELAGINELASSLRLWADGFYGERESQAGPTAFMRLHRNGAAAFASVLPRSEMPQTWPARLLNAVLAYLGSCWQTLGLRTAIELDITMHGLTGYAANETPFTVERGHMFEDPRPARQPTMAPAAHVNLRRDVLLHQAQRAPERHRVIRDFADRFHHAFGWSRAEWLFRSGWLYHQDGPANMCVAGGGLFDTKGQIVARIDENGGVRPFAELNTVKCFYSDGVITSTDGDAVASLELACSDALPDDGPSLARLMSSDRSVVTGGERPDLIEAETDQALPACTRQWSETSLIDSLRT